MVEFVASAAQEPDLFVRLPFSKHKCSINQTFLQVSHFWAEPVKHFTKCLKQHAKDRGLSKSGGRIQVGQGRILIIGVLGWHGGKFVDPHPSYLGNKEGTLQGRNAHYWVCAYVSMLLGLENCSDAALVLCKANNQWKLSEEIAGDSLLQTSFFLALSHDTCIGVVSIIGKQPEVCIIWC